MYRIFTLLTSWVANLFAPRPEFDPLDRMSREELADLPIHHPAADPCVG